MTELFNGENGTAIQYIPSKTKKENTRVVKVYLAPTAIEIMNRNQGKSAKGLFPFVSTGKLNDLIRVAMTQAGITRIVTIVNTAAAVHVIRIVMVLLLLMATHITCTCSYCRAIVVLVMNLRLRKFRP